MIHPVFISRRLYTNEQKIIMNYSKARQLAEIIVKIRLRSATFQERAVLADWLGESEDNRQLYKRIVRGESISKRLRKEDQINESVDFVLVRNSIARRLVRKRQTRRFLRWGSGSVAAACLVGAVLFMLNNKPDEGTRVTPVEENVIVAAKPEMNTRAMLILADGAQIDLIHDIPGVVEQEQAIIRGESGKLSYEVKRDSLLTDEVVEEIFNRVVTYVGGDYFLSLSDGTRVWLNADSELEFPVSFVGNERVVKLRGEAYFEVKQDVRKPFVVDANGLRTRVLGTSFNVKAYHDERSVFTTLVKGSVAVEVADDGNVPASRIVLEPGMQAMWHEGSKAISVQPVNAANIVAWKDGKFIFTEEDMEVVLRTLSRWYGVNFICKDSRMEKYTFNGLINKDEKLEMVLENLTLTGGPVFNVVGKDVYITKK